MGTGVEADPFVSPSPPLHMLGGVHSPSSVYRFGLCEPVRAVAHQMPADVRLSTYRLRSLLRRDAFVFRAPCATAETETVACCSSPDGLATSPAEGRRFSPRMRCSSNSTAARRRPRPHRKSN